MRELLIVETRDAADHKDPARMADLAIGMKRAGVPATIFLTDNGAFSARGGMLGAALSEGVQVAVDHCALDERGIDKAAISSGMSIAGVELVVDALAAGATVMWR
jgi:hypothetical protein